MRRHSDNLSSLWHYIHIGIQQTSCFLLFDTEDAQLQFVYLRVTDMLY